ncbi:uncharacterized protein MONBRDRAFT_3505, partial [Monosiga brevicollis MX1]
RFLQRWLAPEAVESKGYSMAADMYSFGVLMWEIWSLGATPYAQVSDDKVPLQITSQHLLPCPPGCPPSAFDLMRQCWEYRPSARP